MSLTYSTSAWVTALSGYPATSMASRGITTVARRPSTIMSHLPIRGSPQRSAIHTPNKVQNMAQEGALPQAMASAVRADEGPITVRGALGWDQFEGAGCISGTVLSPAAPLQDAAAGMPIGQYPGSGRLRHLDPSPATTDGTALRWV